MVPHSAKGLPGRSRRRSIIRITPAARTHVVLGSPPRHHHNQNEQHNLFPHNVPSDSPQTLLFTPKKLDPETRVLCAPQDPPCHKDPKKNGHPPVILCVLCGEVFSAVYFNRKCGVALEVIASAGPVSVLGSPPLDGVILKPFR